MNELLNELGIKSNSISSGMIEKIKKRENIEILEKYDKSVLHLFTFQMPTLWVGIYSEAVNVIR
jgi:hypothetical protein